MRVSSRLLLARLSLISAAAVLMVAAVFAQGSRGAHPGFGGGIGSGGRPFSVAHGYVPSPELTPKAATYTGIRPGALNSHNGGYGNAYNRGSRGGYGANRNRYYRSLPYAYVASPFYYPYSDFGPSYYPNDSGGNLPPPEGDVPPSMAENALGDQLARLSAEVDQMHSQMAGVPSPAPYPSSDQEPAAAPITVVLRDGEQLKVQNYAVMNQTFWDFSHQPAKQIPISSIDVPASTKATAENGGEFPQVASTASR